MAVYKRASRRRSVLVLLVLTSLTLITLDVRGGNGGITRSVRDFAQDAVAPVQEGVDGLFTPISDWWAGVTRAADIRDENVRLRRQLAEARGEQAVAQGALRENRALKGLTKLTFVQDIPGVDAQIVTGSPGNFESTVGLDKGREAGIGPGMPVVAGEGLVGRVTDASGRRSTVLLLTDPGSGVSVRLAKSGLLGIASGRSGSDLLRLDVESGDTVVKRGDLVVTAGTEPSRYPAGIPVGRVASVSKAPGALEPSILLKPLVDFRRLEFVRVLQWPLARGPG